MMESDNIKVQSACEEAVISLHTEQTICDLKIR